MAITLKRTLTGRRNAPLGQEWDDIVDAEGEPIDLTAATDVKMQFRLFGAAAGNALITLDPVVTAFAEGLTLGVGSLGLYIHEAPLKTLPEKAPGESIRIVGDALFEFAGVVPEVWIEVDLVVEYGVTDRLGLRITGAGDYRITSDGSLRVTG